VSAEEHALAYRVRAVELDSGADRGGERSVTPSPSPTALAFALTPQREGKDLGADDAGTTGTVDAGTPAAATPAASGKSIDIWPISLPGSSRSAATDIARANAIWAQCSVAVNMAGGESWDTDVMDLLDPKGVLNEYPNPHSPTVEETTMLAHHPGGSAIHAYFVPSMSAGSRGESFGPSWTPSIPAVVISDSAASDSLAHELGHVLMDDVSHDPDPDNLMASGSIRNVGVDKLTAAQCAKV
jgi:hypothetical protein